MSVGGSSTMGTLRGTTVPTRTSKFTVLTRGADDVNTLCRILVFCSVLSVTWLDPPPLRPAVVPALPPCLVVPSDAPCFEPPSRRSVAPCLEPLRCSVCPCCCLLPFWPPGAVSVCAEPVDGC